MAEDKKFVNGIYANKKDFNNGFPPFFKLKIDLEKMYQYVDDEGFLKVDMFQNKNKGDNGEIKYYFVLDEYKKEKESLGDILDNNF